jgi:hypothetical protein
MLQVLQFLATFCTVLFGDAALYINVAEHPARMLGDARFAVKHWAESYRRATPIQAPLALVGLVYFRRPVALGAGVWRLAGLLIGAVVPFTLIVVLPTSA